MIVEYSRSLSHNYMLIREDGEGPADTYELRILMSNRIPGILPMEIEEADGRIRYLCDITACEPFQSVCEGSRMTAAELRAIYSSLLDCLGACEDYLLDSSHLVLDFAYLYYRSEEAALLMPYVPSYTRDIRLSLIAFTEAVIMHISHGRQDAIVLACRILHELQSRELQIARLRQFLLPSGEEESVAEAGGTDRLTLKGHAREGEERSHGGGEQDMGRGSFAERAAKTGRLSPKARVNANAEEPPAAGGFRPLYAMEDPFFETDAEPQRAGNRKGEKEDRRRNRGNASLAAAIRTQIPERDTIRMALMAALPAGAIFIILEVQTVCLLSLREVLGISLLTAAGILIILRILERRNRNRAASKEEEDAFLFTDSMDTACGYGAYSPQEGNETEGEPCEAPPPGALRALSGAAEAENGGIYRET